jgi:hypothetical protein
MKNLLSQPVSLIESQLEHTLGLISIQSYPTKVIFF